MIILSTFLTEQITGHYTCLICIFRIENIYFDILWCTYSIFIHFTVEDFVSGVLDETHKWFKNASTVHRIQPKIKALRDFAKANPSVCCLINLATYHSDDSPSTTQISVQGQVTPFTIPEEIKILEILSKGSVSYTFRATFYDFLPPSSDLKGHIEVKMSTLNSATTHVSQVFISNQICFLKNVMFFLFLKEIGNDTSYMKSLTRMFVF